MPSLYDLHTHSTASDGTLSPEELVRRASAAGLGCLALTDHDTLEGLPQAAAAARGEGVDLVPGVEISVTWRGHTVHLVGLQVDPACAALRGGLAGLRGFRDWRAEEIGRRLAGHGIPSAFEGARALSNGHLISRTHFARFLVQQGVAADERQVFKHYLVRGKPGYVPGQWATLGDAVGWIREAGGQAVLAHPARYRLTRTRLQHLLGELRQAGGEALEVVSGSHSRDDCLVMACHAQEQGLLCSVGSDYHGPPSPWIDLGHLPRLPDGCVPVWRDWLPPRRLRSVA
jgi:predicted metal-dependent phosphoesterase TrpH